MDIREIEEQNKNNGEKKSKLGNLNKRKAIVYVVIILVITNLFSMYIGSVIALPLGAKVMISKEDNETLNDTKKIMAKNNNLTTALASYNGVLKFNQLFQVWDDLHKYYFGDIKDDTLVEGAIKGMTASLNDPYTVFMNAKEYSDFNTQTQGNYVGLGIQVGVKDNKITVIAPFDGSPAKKAGIVTGDIIDKVNGKEVTGNDLDLAVSLMKGKENEAVTITITNSSNQTKDIIMKREKINLVTVTGEMIDKTIGYVHLSMFDENSAKEFNDKLKELKNKGMKGLILDLRGNPGGLLTTCVDISSNFVPKDKLVVSMKDKNGKEEKYNSKDGGLAIGMPLVILTDDGTASASEILSGAVKDYKIGTLVGENTFGKGVVQTVMEYKENATALKVTIAKYYTPSGVNIHKIGIKPDIELKCDDSLKSINSNNKNADPQFQKALEVVKDKLKQ